MACNGNLWSVSVDNVVLLVRLRGVGAGAFSLLADLGAEVVRIEDVVVIGGVKWKVHKLGGVCTHYSIF